MTALHLAHLPRKITKLTIGIRKNGLMDSPHAGHFDLDKSALRGLCFIEPSMNRSASV